VTAQVPPSSSIAEELAKDDIFQVYRQMEALTALYHVLQPRKPLPPMRRWAISPDYGRILYEEIHRTQAKTIIEMSTGASTLISAYALEQLGRGMVIALEEHQHFSQVSQDNIAFHELNDYAQVVHAPLSEITVSDETYWWYRTDALQNISEIDLISVDGPSQYNSDYNKVRFPAVPILIERLRVGGRVLVDDAYRSHEREMVADWLELYPNLRVIREDETEKGTVILEKM